MTADRCGVWVPGLARQSAHGGDDSDLGPDRDGQAASVALGRIGERLRRSVAQPPCDKSAGERIQQVVRPGAVWRRRIDWGSGKPPVISSARRRASPGSWQRPFTFFGCASARAPFMRQNASSGCTSNTRETSAGSARSTASTSRIFGAMWKSCFDTLRGGSDVANAAAQASA
jgi:hypothetical protein